MTTMKAFFMLGAVAVLSLTGCGDDSDSDGSGEVYSLTVNGDAYTPHVGSNIFAILVDDAGTEVATGEVVVPESGEWTLTLADSLEEGKSYSFSWYADINDDGTCQPPNGEQGDHVWKRAVDDVTADVTIDHTHAMDFATCTDFE